MRRHDALSLALAASLAAWPSASAIPTTCTAYAGKSDCPAAPAPPPAAVPECGALSGAAERFLVIGDFGLASAGCEARVAALAASLEERHGPVSFVMTTGDNDYWDGSCATMHGNIGAHWGRFFTPGSQCVDPQGTAGDGPPQFLRGRGAVTRVARIPDERVDAGAGGAATSTIDRTGNRSGGGGGGGGDLGNNGTGSVFFPTIGNHDWDKYKAADDRGLAIPYLQYFDYLADLDGDGAGGQFYRRVLLGGQVEIFALNSNLGVPGSSARHLELHARQVEWLRGALGDSTAPFRLVYFHHPPRSTAQHDAIAAWMDLPYAAWGASAVFSGHQHVYERLNGSLSGEPSGGAPKMSGPGIPYIVNGLAGHPWLYDIHSCTPYPGSEVRYNAAHGAMIGGVVAGEMQMCFYSIEGGAKLVDSFSFPPRG
jgi:hypothetical protein